MFERLQEIITERMSLKTDGVTMESSFTEDLGADSLDMVEFCCLIEDEFDLPVIGPDIAAGFVTVSDVVRFLEKACK